MLIRFFASLPDKDGWSLRSFLALLALDVLFVKNDFGQVLFHSPVLPPVRRSR
jgi:hypothetical protein